MKTKIAILGSAGSIGKNLLDVIYKDQYLWVSYSENRGGGKSNTSIAKGKFNRKNILILLMAIELLLLSINTNFLVFSHFNDNIDGHIFVLFILAIAAAESAIGLAIIVSIFKSMKGTLFFFIRIID